MYLRSRILPYFILVAVVTVKGGQDILCQFVILYLSVCPRYTKLLLILLKDNNVPWISWIYTLPVVNKIYQWLQTVANYLYIGNSNGCLALT